MTPTPLRASIRPYPDVADFARRANPLLHRGLLDAAHAVPTGLGPVDDAVLGVLGLKGSQGRRWRPLLTLAVADATGGDMADAVDAAVAVELTHAASLVLDDLPCMDDSNERRGAPATHRLVGSAGAILVAVGLLARAAEFLGRSRDGAALVSDWGNTFGFMGMSGGQAVDMITGGACYGGARRLYRRKTTALAAFAVTAGARASGADPVLLPALRRFGRDVGWAYQLVDDAHDLHEDLAAGRADIRRDPLRQGTRILNRALQRVHKPGVLGRDTRVSLLSHLAREVVGLPSAHEATGQDSAEEVA